MQQMGIKAASTPSAILFSSLLFSCLFLSCLLSSSLRALTVRTSDQFVLYVLYDSRNDGTGVAQLLSRRGALCCLSELFARAGRKNVSRSVSVLPRGRGVASPLGALEPHKVLCT